MGLRQPSGLLLVTLLVFCLLELQCDFLDFSGISGTDKMSYVLVL